MARFKPESQPSANQGELAHAMRRLQRRQRRWLLVKLLIFLVLVIAGGLFYLQSAHALKTFVLPLISRQLGAKVTAEDGSIGLGGTTELAGVEIADPKGKPIFQADRLRLNAAPLSLLGRNPVIREAWLENAQARVVVDEDGRSNWDFLLPKKAAKPKQAAQTPPKPGAAKKAPRAVTIDKLKLSNAALQLDQAGQMQLILSNVDLALEEFGQGKQGAFGLTAEGTLDRPGIHHSFSASGKGSLFPEEKKLGWNGTLDVKYNPDAQQPKNDQTVTIKALLEGSTAAGRIDQQFSFSAATARGAAGQFKGAVLWDDAKGEHQATVDASNVDRELLNPFLAMAGPLQIERSKINGSLKITQRSKSEIDIATTVKGSEMTFRVGEQKTLTPAVSMAFEQRGAYDTGKQLLKLDAATLTLQEKGQPVLESRLDRPVELQVGQGAAAAAGTTARINTTLKNLPWPALQPWLMLAGVKEAEMVKGGRLSGEILSVVENAGGTIELDGQIQGARMILPKWQNVPLDLTQTIKGRIDKLDTVTVETARTTLVNAGKTLADATAQARLTASSGAIEATVRLVCPQAAATARTVGWLAADAASVKQDGRLEATETLTVAGKGKPAAVKGTASLAGMVLAGTGGTVPLAGTAEYDFTADGQTVSFSTLRARLASGGTVEAKGSWPLAGGSGRGELKLTARGVDLAPWLRLSAQPGAVSVAKLPMEADQTLTTLADGTNKMAGELRLGPIPAEGIPATADPPVSISIKHQATRLGEQVQSLVVELATRTRKGAADRIALNGNGQMGAERIALKMGGKIERLDADGLAALAGLLRGGAAEPAARKNTPAQAAALPAERMVAEEGATDSAAAPAAAPAKQARKILLDINPLEIGRILYQRNELKDGKGTFRFENGVSEIKLEQGRLCGGSIAGNGQLDMAKAEPRYAWEVALKEADVSALCGMVRPDLARRVSGKGDLASRGSGQGTGPDARRRLQSETGFQITNGEVREIFLLDALAKQTKISELKNLQFFEFSGRVSTSDGVATLKDWTEKGKEQRVSLEGTVALLDGKYDLAFQPAVSKSVAGRMSGNGIAQQILSDASGFFILPFQVAISGQGTNYQLGARGDMSKEGKEQMTENLRGMLQGVIEEQMQKRQERDQKKKDKEEKKGRERAQQPGEADSATSAGEPARATRPTRSTLPSPAKEPAVDTERNSQTRTEAAPTSAGTARRVKVDRRDALEGLLGEGLKIYQQREQEKKEKRDKKKKREDGGGGVTKVREPEQVK